VLEVVLQGVTDGTHTVNILLNNAPVGQMVFDSQSNVSQRFTIPQAGLLEGDNFVSLIAQGGETDVSLVDYIRLTYWHTYTAEDDALKFTAQGGKQVSISGFSSPNIRVMDITDPNAVVEVLGKVGSKGTAITVGVAGSGQRTLLAFSTEGIKKPLAVVANQPSKWHEGGNAADLVIIVHGSLLGSLGQLEAFRESQGWLVALIDVEDLYDEFSFGNKTPQALRDFLLRAKSSWRKVPRFVLLVGDASKDPRNYLGLGAFDLVPTKLIDTAYLETASDDWFADFNGDGLPKMAFGRVPVRTPDQATAVVRKIISYEKAPAGPWTKQALFVADEYDGSFNFEEASGEVSALLPGDMVVSEIFRSDFNGNGDDLAAKQAVLAGINQGPLLVNYIGHGSETTWAGNLLISEDAGGLFNVSFPFFINMTCLNGTFQDVYKNSLAEALLKAGNGGAVAVWTSSGLTEPDIQIVMNKQLMKLLFNGQNLTLGEATAKAKAAVSDMDVRRTWILFGDPTIRLK
jgi:hypothetical protein